MDPIWAPTSIEIQKLSKPNIFTIWLYNQALEKEKKTQELIYKQSLEKQKLMEKQIMLEKAASAKAILINQSHKPKSETRINNDGSICKFLY
jgi:hypothetical protein